MSITKLQYESSGRSSTLCRGENYRYVTSCMSVSFFFIFGYVSLYSVLKHVNISMRISWWQYDFIISTRAASSSAHYLNFPLVESLNHQTVSLRWQNASWDWVLCLCFLRLPSLFKDPQDGDWGNLVGTSSFGLIWFGFTAYQPL